MTAGGQNLIDLTGKRFGRWTVLSRGPIRPEHHATWYARCDCGAVHLIIGKTLRTGASTKCVRCRERTGADGLIRCCRCKQRLAPDEFASDPNTKCGRYAYCYSCDRGYRLVRGWR